MGLLEPTEEGKVVGATEQGRDGWIWVIREEERDREAARRGVSSGDVECWILSLTLAAFSRPFSQTCTINSAGACPWRLIVEWEVECVTIQLILSQAQDSFSGP